LQNNTNNSKTHVYFVPGLAAGKEIFENISLPKENFEIHIVEWKIPKKNESISQYARRMAAEVNEPNPVLIGVSFGGVMVQEMNNFLKVQKLIIISSVKSKKELPRKMKVFKVIPAYRLIPKSFLENTKSLVKYGLGIKSKKKLELYQNYLSVKNTDYLKWAIKQMVSWNQPEEIENIIHIHGDKDNVFPIKKIKNCIVIPEGTHIMLITKYKWINTNLPKIIEGTFK